MDTVKLQKLQKELQAYNASYTCVRPAAGERIEEMAATFEEWLLIAMGAESGSMLYKLALEKLRVMLVDFRSLMNALLAAPADREDLKKVLLNKLPKAAGSTEQYVELHDLAPSEELLLKAMDLANSFPRIAEVVKRMPPGSKGLEKGLKTAIFKAKATFDAFKASFDVAPATLKEVLLLKMSEVATTSSEWGIIADVAEPGSDTQKNALEKKSEAEAAEAAEAKSKTETPAEAQT